MKQQQKKDTKLRETLSQCNGKSQKTCSNLQARFPGQCANFSRTMSNDRHSPVHPFFSPCVWVNFHAGGSGFTCAFIHLLTVILSSMLVYFGCELGAYMTFH